MKKKLYPLLYSCLTIASLVASCKKEEAINTSDQAPDNELSSSASFAATNYKPFTVRTIAGVFGQATTDPHLVDGPGPQAKFWKPHGITVDSDGSIYIADFLNSAIRKLSITNQVTTIPIPVSGSILPEAVGISANGTFYIVSTGYGVRIYNKSKGIDITSRIGNADSNLDLEKDCNGVMWFVNDNSLCKITGTTVQRNVVNFSDFLDTNETLRGIGVGPGGVKYVSTATKLFKVTSSGTITRMFPSQRFIFISGITVTKDGKTLYIADGNAIKKIYQNSIVTIARPGAGDGKDGIGLDADVVAANLALSNSEKALFVTDTRNVIRKITLP